MLSALLMMFAVFGVVMWIGAISGDNDQAAYGNKILFFVMLSLTLIVLGTGLFMRSRTNAKIDALIDTTLHSAGLVDAALFATQMNISLDDARDVLDKRIQRRKWQRTELEHYNAQYRSL
jgi:hypothetical protein